MAYIQIILNSNSFLIIFQWSIVCCYLMLMIQAFYGWNKTREKPVNASILPISVSIIVAAKNEDKNLFALFNDLELQTYPMKLVEWIIIDDHSVNKISELPFVTSKKYQNLKIIELDGNTKGKKAALALGVMNSTGELLIFTDGDCRVKPEWIESFVSKYLEEKSGMIIGLVDYPIIGGVFNIFYRFELLSLVVTGAGLLKTGIPVMCNGANIAVRSDLYKKKIGSIKHKVESGDDIFMLHAIKKDRSEKISLLKQKKSIVITDSPVSIKEFLNQRSRWASKSTSYNDGDTIILAVIVLFTNLIILIGFLNFIFTGNHVGILFLFLIKIFADCLILISGLLYFGGVKNLILLPFFSIIYPCYIFTASARSIFKIYSWK